MSDRGMHLFNQKIQALNEEFQIHHAKSTPYHPQENGAVEDFSKILEHALTKVWNADRSDWDVHIPSILWAYWTTYKKLTGRTPFWMVYGKEAIMPIEYIFPSLHITTFTNMADPDII